MSIFLHRVQRLRERLAIKENPPVILTYGNGSVREMAWMDAFKEIGCGADVVDVQYPDKTGQSLLAAMLPGVENGENLLEDINDKF